MVYYSEYIGESHHSLLCSMLLVKNSLLQSKGFNWEHEKLLQESGRLFSLLFCREDFLKTLQVLTAVWLNMKAPTSKLKESSSRTLYYTLRWARKNLIFIIIEALSPH